MDLRTSQRVLHRYWRSMLAVVLAVVAVAAVLTFAQTPRYTSTAQMFFGVQGGESVSDLAQGSTYTEKQMTSFARVATSPLVLRPVIADLGLTQSPRDLANDVTATVPLETVILEIEVSSTDPAQSARIANAIAAEVASSTSRLVPQAPGGTQAVRATVLTEAEPPDSPSSPRPVINLGLGLVLGSALAVAMGVLRLALNSKIRSEQDLAALTDSAILGVVPHDADTPTHPVVMHSDPQGARAEGIRRVRANLQFVDVDDGVRSMVISSSVPGEGKTTVAINLAVSLAESGQKVILVDADLRRPAVARYLGLEGNVGLTTVLIGKAEPMEVVQPWQGTSLDILPAGRVPLNPSELLGSRAMAALIDKLTGSYDLVLLDSSPLLPVADTLLLSKVVSGTVLVVGADRARRAQLRDTLESLASVEADLLGLVINKIARRDASTYAYKSSYTAEWTPPRGPSPS